MSEKKSSDSLANILIRRNVVPDDVLETAREEAKSSGLTLERYLVENDLVRGDQMTLAISEYLGMQPISLAHFIPDLQLIETLPRQTLSKHQIIPITQTGKNLTVALGDPFNIMAIDELHIQTGLDITSLVASEQEVSKVLEQTKVQEAGALDMEDIMNEEEDGGMSVGSQEELEQQSLEEMMESAEDRPVIRMVNMILIEAIKLGASDIHIEPQEDKVRLRYRVDGVLIEHPSIPKSLQSAIISRVKIMADMDIGEQRLPQDGRFRITALGKAIDVRVSILPSIFGGRVVLRTLDKSALFPNLAALDLDKRAYDSLSYAIAQPHGIILVTGPTGSGKTTTLYSCLQELNKPDINLTTCEDPVEYQVPGIIQVKINTDVGCTFGAALRAILRQDPDIVLIGEIRDSETCEIAIKAALTGHLVLSTLHANDASGTITRLLDMGMEPFLLASSLILAQAQRLFRKLCPNCRKEAKPSQKLLKEHHVPLDFFNGTKIYEAKGCHQCHNMGYRGRNAIMEVLTIDEDVRLGIMRKAMADEIEDIATGKGMVTLRQAALEKVKEGSTSIEEALKITVSR
ncbi:GspE/PulE family protein [Verrucomicrobiota bacterium]